MEKHITLTVQSETGLQIKTFPELGIPDGLELQLWKYWQNQANERPEDYGELVSIIIEQEGIS